MFQNFEVSGDPTAGKARLSLLRDELRRRGLDGFLIPRADEHQGEYVPPAAERLAWLTGFGGSAGIAAVLADKAAIFVDGRYTVQVREQVDTAIFEPLHLFEYGPEKWLGEEVREGMRIGYDPRLHTIGGIRSLRRAVEGAGGELVAIDDNPVDAVWADRPPPPSGRIVVQPDSLAGRSAADKIAGLREALAKAKADATVLTQPDSIAWTFNIRGGDVPHTPFALGFAIVPAEGRPLLAMDGRKFSNESRDHVEAVADIVEPGDFEARLREIAAGRRIMLDPNWAAASLARSVEEAGGTVVEGGDLAALPKATKNEAEIAGARAAHLRDAVAYARFLAWFDREGFKTDEIAVARKLEAFRSDTGELKDLSFDTISAAGGHAAIPHYRVTTATNLAIPPDSLFLIDSGAQFQDGTTDITRTIAVGDPPAEAVRRATLVLKGHIAIASARFPEGTTGAQLDTLARIALWNAGLDFDHGTGHGVGSYLSVHEGPQRLAKTGHQPLRTGMILSNEPGYYQAGEYGIRIENLIVVSPPGDIPGGERRMHAFETITFAPIDLRLVDATLLSEAEADWLDAYHARVRALLEPRLEGDDRAWLEQATRPLDRPNP